MSLNASDKDSSVPKLTRANYTTWLMLIEDHIMALDHDDAPDIWENYIWRPDPNHDPAADDGYGRPAFAGTVPSTFWCMPSPSSWTSSSHSGRLGAQIAAPARRRLAEQPRA